MIIYGILNTSTGKWYVGSTTQPRVRYQSHRRMLENNKHHSPKLQNAWNKYGSNSFIFIELDQADNEHELTFLEHFWTDTYDALHNGYVCIKANRAEISPSTIELMKSRRQGENAHMFGKRHSEETKQRQSESQRGSKNHRFGKHHSDEHKAYMSMLLKGRESPNKGKRLNLTDEQREQLRIRAKMSWENGALRNRAATTKKKK
jgi:group I intron endonuclease